MESGSKTLLLQEIALPVASHHLPCNRLEPAGHSQLTLHTRTSNQVSIVLLLAEQFAIISVRKTKSNSSFSQRVFFKMVEMLSNGL